MQEIRGFHAALLENRRVSRAAEDATLQRLERQLTAVLSQIHNLQELLRSVISVYGRPSSHSFPF